MTDQQIQKLIGLLLRAGVAASALLVGAGAAWYLTEQGGVPVAVKAPPPETWTGPRFMMGLGLIVLAATPVARVALSLWAFLAERDYLYAAIATTVLLILAASLSSPWW